MNELIEITVLSDFKVEGAFAVESWVGWWLVVKLAVAFSLVQIHGFHLCTASPGMYNFILLEMGKLMLNA
jgi:hypothetical protein